MKFVVNGPHFEWEQTGLLCFPPPDPPKQLNSLRARCVPFNKRPPVSRHDDRAPSQRPSAESGRALSSAFCCHQVTAPVRESCAQTLSVVASHLEEKHVFGKTAAAASGGWFDAPARACSAISFAVGWTWSVWYTSTCPALPLFVLEHKRWSCFARAPLVLEAINSSSLVARIDKDGLFLSVLFLLPWRWRRESSRTARSLRFISKNCNRWLGLPLRRKFSCCKSTARIWNLGVIFPEKLGSSQEFLVVFIEKPLKQWSHKLLKSTLCTATHRLPGTS